MVLQRQLPIPVWGWADAGEKIVVTFRGQTVHAIAGASFPHIRLYTVPQKAAVAPFRAPAGSWSACTPEAADTFSAVAYFFGRELHRKLGVPVGLINSSWGGTMAEAWTSRDRLVSLPQFKDLVARYEANLANPERDKALFQEKLRANAVNVLNLDA